MVGIMWCFLYSVFSNLYFVFCIQYSRLFLHLCIIGRGAGMVGILYSVFFFTSIYYLVGERDGWNHVQYVLCTVYHQVYLLLV